MPQPRFGIGSRVVLNSGGPEMLVVDLSLPVTGSDHRITCAWRAADGGIREVALLDVCVRAPRPSKRQGDPR